MLASQFVTGLCPELQSKVVGLEGSMDQLVMKTRFEEAKNKELTPARTTTTQPKKIHPISHTTSTSSTSKSSKPVLKTGSSDTTSSKISGNARKCCNCGLNGHMARACPYPNSTQRDGEATGRPVSVVSVEVPTDALVDTGSLATIVSLMFILKVLADRKDSQQTAEEWKKETIKKFSAPAVTLTSCGGD